MSSSTAAASAAKPRPGSGRAPKRVPKREREEEEVGNDDDDQNGEDQTGVRSVAIVLSKSRAEHNEFVAAVREHLPLPYGLNVVKPSELSGASGAILVDRFCDEFLMLMRLRAMIPSGTTAVLYVLGDLNLQPHERKVWSLVVQKPAGDAMRAFVDSLR